MNEHEEKFYLQGIESQVVNQGWAFCLLPDGSNFSITLPNKWTGRVYNQEQGATFWEAETLAELFVVGREKTGKELKVEDFYEKGSLGWGQRDHRMTPELHRTERYSIYDGNPPLIRMGNTSFPMNVQRWIPETKIKPNIGLELGDHAAMLPEIPPFVPESYGAMVRPEEYDPGTIPGYEPETLKVASTPEYALLMKYTSMPPKLEAGLIEMCSLNTGILLERVREIIEQERERRGRE